MSTSIVRSGLLGLATGDALGVPHEFKPRHELARSPVSGMDGFGVWNYPPGTWSDDSSLAFCLAESLSTAYDLRDVADRFVSWHDTGYWSARGEPFGIGRSTAAAISRLRDASVHPARAGLRREQDNGNGSLMRILPIVFCIRDKSSDERAWIISELSSLTHGHRRTQLACILYIETALLVLKGLDLSVAWKTAAADFSTRYASESEIAPFSRILSEQFREIPVEMIHSSAYVIDSLEAAYWCLLSTSTYKDAVLKAVNLGGDTDTIGAITGGLAGLYYGEESIPESWLSTIARREDIEALSERLASRCYQ